MVPFLVATDPNAITEDGHAILLDSNGERLTHDFEALRGSTRLAATCQGWILSLGSEQEDNRRSFLYDPYTCDKIELPRFDDTLQLPRDFSAALSSDKPTTTNNTIVVVLHPDQTTLWYCRVVIAGSGGEQNNNDDAADAAEWIKYEYDVGTQQKYCDDAEGLVWRKIIIWHLTACQGRFYFPATMLEHGILEFDPHPAIRVVAMGGLPEVVPPNPWGWCAHICHFEMDGEHYQLLAYFYMEPAVTTGIALYRMDVGRRRWCEVVDGIGGGGDRALLWCGYGGGCCTASRFGLEPDCVYMIHPFDNLMHVFNLAARTERVCFHPSEDLAKLPSGAFWLLPTNTD